MFILVTDSVVTHSKEHICLQPCFVL